MTEKQMLRSSECSILALPMSLAVHKGYKRRHGESRKSVTGGLPIYSLNSSGTLIAEHTLPDKSLINRDIAVGFGLMQQPLTTKWFNDGDTKGPRDPSIFPKANYYDIFKKTKY